MAFWAAVRRLMSDFFSTDIGSSDECFSELSIDAFNSDLSR
jgi:hypothetical protein